MDTTVVPTRPLAATYSPAGALGLCIFSALVLSPAVLALFVADTQADQAGSALAFSLALWSFWLAVWGNPYRGCLAATPFLLTAAAADYLLLTYRQQLNPQVIGIVLETNPQESMQYLRGVSLFLVLGFVAIIVAGCFALVMMRKHEVQWRPRWRIAALIGAPLIIGILHFLYQPLETAASWIKPLPNSSHSTPWPLELESARFSSPFGVILQVADGVSAELKAASVARLANFRFGSRQAIQSADRQVYVLVIGESSREDRWSLNGYKRRTAPLLQQESNLVSFGDVITVAPWTRNSVPVILTRKSAEQALDLQFPERSLVSAFREAGFATYWMSMQSPIGPFDAAYSSYANEAEHLTYFNMTGGFSGDTPADGVMLGPLRKALAATTETRQLIVIHTLGSHMQYRKRYPDEFDVFKPSLASSAPITQHDAAYEAELDNAYDNTILYTDYFLSQVIAAVKASGRPLATVLYVSDHGEDLLDGGCGKSGHGHATPQSVRVPLFFWYSDTYQQTFPEKVATLRRNGKEPLTTESVFPLLLDAAAIQFPTEDMTRSVMSPAFTRHVPRIFRTMEGSTINFDRAHQNAECELVN